MRFRPRLYNDDLSSDSTKQEERIASEVDGHRQRGSGSSDYAKGDVKHSKFLFECKTTMHASMSVKKAWLNKITAEAMAVQKYPALTIEMEGDHDPLVDRDWVMIPMHVFKKLLGE